MTGATDPVEVVRRRFLVSGRVQGVFFRDSCRREAERLGVDGWASNLPDGRVEVVAEGQLAAVEQLGQWCRQGPPRALVTSMAATSEAPEGVTGFRTR